MYERAGARPQLLSLPTPSPCEACQGDRAQCRFMPCGGPADGPTSHRGELVYAGHDQVDQYQAECDPPVEERACPATGQRACSASAELARVLLLCSLRCYISYHTTWLP